MQRFMTTCGTGLFLVFLSLLMLVMMSFYAGMAYHFQAYGMAIVGGALAVFAAYGAVITIRDEILPFFVVE